jgi:hypothetical protein
MRVVHRLLGIANVAAVARTLEKRHALGGHFAERQFFIVVGVIG